MSGEQKKVNAKVDLGPEPVDVDWGDGTTSEGASGVVEHGWPAGAHVTITVTAPGTGLSLSTPVRVPAAPRAPQVSFEPPAAGRKSKTSQGGTS